MKLKKQVRHQTLFKLVTWFDPHGIVNIISISIEKKFPAAFNTMEIFFAVQPQD